jgi:hypothetical protein
VEETKKLGTKFAARPAPSSSSNPPRHAVWNGHEASDSNAQEARVLDGKSRAVRSIGSILGRDCWLAFNASSRCRYPTPRVEHSKFSKTTRIYYHVHPDVRPAVAFAPSASGRSRASVKNACRIRIPTLMANFRSVWGARLADLSQ